MRKLDSSSSSPSDEEMIDPGVRAEEVRREIARQGMPAAVRPPLLGQTRIIDTARPAEESTSVDTIKNLPTVTTPANAEDGLVDKLYGLLLSRLRKEMGCEESTPVSRPAAPPKGGNRPIARH